MTVATTIPASAATSTDETRAALRARADRGLALFEKRGSEIVRTGPFTYLVPGSGPAPYAVDYAAETCGCKDFEHAGLWACKHLFAVGASRAARRSRTAEGLRLLEERFRSEIMDEDERCELRDRIVRARRFAGLPSSGL